MYYLFSALAIVSETISGIYICDAFLNRALMKKVFILFAILKGMLRFSLVSYVITVPVSTEFVDFSIYILWVLFVFLGYKGKVWQKFLTIFFAVGFIAALDWVVSTLFCMELKISSVELLLDPYLWLFTMFISKTLLFTESYFFKHIYKDKEKFDKNNRWIWSAVLIIPMFTIFNLSVFVQTVKFYKSLESGIFINALGLFLINVTLVILLEYVAEEQKVRAENIAYRQEIKNRMEAVDMWTAEVDKQKKLAHDFNHHLGVLHMLLERKETDVAKDYIENMTMATQGNVVVDTHNPVINAVLNQKFWLAEEKGVGMSFKINDLSKFPIEKADLVIVLGNLLDNAIEAAENVFWQASIVVKMTMIDGECVLSVRNTSNPVKINGNEIVTSKTNKKDHGFGLQNVKTILEKYDFDYVMDYADGWFQFSAFYS